MVVLLLLCGFRSHLCICIIIPPSCIQGAVCLCVGEGVCVCVWCKLSECASLSRGAACDCRRPAVLQLAAHCPPHPPTPTPTPTHSQMRNLVLSAFPRAMRLPDPFTPNLKVDLLPEIGSPPRFVPAPEQLLPAPLRSEVDGYLAARGPPALLMGLRTRLTLAPADALVCGTKYNVPLINALAFYVGCRAVEASPPKPGAPPAMATPHMELLQHLLRDLDTGGCSCRGDLRCRIGGNGPHLP